MYMYLVRGCPCTHKVERGVDLQGLVEDEYEYLGSRVEAGWVPGVTEVIARTLLVEPLRRTRKNRHRIPSIVPGAPRLTGTVRSCHMYRMFWMSMARALFPRNSKIKLLMIFIVGAARCPHARKQLISSAFIARVFRLHSQKISKGLKLNCK